MNLKQGTITGVKLCRGISGRESSETPVFPLIRVYYFCKKKITLGLIGSDNFKLSGNFMWTKKMT